MNGWRIIGQICALLLAYEAGRLREVCLWIDILLSALSMFVLVVANSLGESKKEGGNETIPRPATEQEIEDGKAKWCEACATDCPDKGKDLLCICGRFKESEAHDVR